MALSASTVWEVRTAGNDTNGGGFVTGASGTDWSQQDAVKYALTGVTTAAANAIMLTASASTDMVGNILNIVSGTNFTVGWYQITAVSAGVSITVDRNCTSAAGALGVVNIGGAITSPGLATGQSVSGNDIWIKTGTYTISSSSAGVSNGRMDNKGGSQGNSGRIRGYNTARWTGAPTTSDLANKPILQASGISNVIICDSSAGNNGAYENIASDGASLTTMVGFNNSGGGTIRFQWCKALNCFKYGFSLNSNASAFDLETTNCGTSNSTPAILATGCGVSGFYCHADRGLSLQPGVSGINFSNGIISGCLDTILGSVYLSQTRAVLTNVTIYGGAAAGVELTASNSQCRNVVVYGCATFGFKDGTSDDNVLLVNCAGGNNTSGNVQSNILNNINFVTLSGDPFVASGSGNFALNNTAGAGASCRAAGIPGAFPGGTTTGYLDIGAAQSQSSGGLLVNPGMTGGIRG